MLAGQATVKVYVELAKLHLLDRKKPIPVTFAITKIGQVELTVDVGCCRFIQVEDGTVMEMI
ncbi:MAG: hypothetical protein A3J65_02625 [Candidatus Buchananbacteria bacterium RIFCSPHIGHO2_02_FULL_45_11b]|uniref:Uncharacterized protein n=2 Tax=Candidatus Buchananiibacteriota TaxID=1817903 RepID=A0A1G1YFZ3_9BACT|nr:MAG: hypothetical protein A3J65_02625 [Candidatus Buchananbacteria bacterium RIFCSPHIGHO2_02_FULL_45_11b]OGY55821.1 MAG: hypothetical protein A3H67_01410 [Candidatus Buchananbacteria bacterium RIFCSPLOWO2_02_FULL_46_11b]